MNYNPHTPFSEQDYHLVKTSISKGSNQKEVLRYLTNVLPNPTDVVTLDNAQDTVKSVKAQLANKNLFDETTLLSKDHTEDEEAYIFENNKIGGANLLPNTTFKYKTQYTLQYTAKQENPASSTTMGYPRFEVVYTDGTKSLQQITTEYTTITITSTFDKTVSAIKFEYSNVGKFYLKKDSLSLVEGTVALSPYSPYISDLTTVNVTRCGKNLFNQSLLTDWGLVLTDGKYVGAAANLNGKTLASNFQNNTQYTISLKGYNTNSTQASVLISVNYTDGTSATVIRLTAQSETEYKFTTEKGKTVSSFKSTYYNADTVNISYIQIEEGSTVTAYEPYQGQTYTPTASGEVTGITVLSPTTNIINDKGLLFTKVIGDDFNYIN